MRRLSVRVPASGVPHVTHTVAPPQPCLGGVKTSVPWHTTGPDFGGEVITSVLWHDHRPWFGGGDRQRTVAQPQAIFGWGVITIGG